MKQPFPMMHGDFEIIREKRQKALMIDEHRKMKVAAPRRTDAYFSLFYYETTSESLLVRTRTSRLI
jgi:hypothetical protein